MSVNSSHTPTHVDWNPAWPEETMRLAYEESGKATEALLEWAESLDSKALAVSAASAGILTLVATLREQSIGSQAEAVLWGLAFISWLGASWSCYEALAPKEFRHGPHPGLLVDPEWLGIGPAEYRFFRLRYLGKTFQANVEVIAGKGKRLRSALVWGAAEIIFLVLAQLARLT